MIFKAQRSATRRASVPPVRRFLALFSPVVTAALVALLLLVWGDQATTSGGAGAMTTSAVLGPPPEAIADYLEAAGLMVLVGTMVDVGLARRPVDDIAMLLSSRDNQLTSPPAPPQGLYFVAA